MYKITFLIPLLDRSEYTKIFINENIIDECYYIFADGSHGDSNYNIFKNIKKNNVKYIRYNKDKNFHNFMKKMADVSTYIKTPYVMTSDNDDFINYDGVFKCLNFLDLNNDYALASGETLFLNSKDPSSINDPKYSFNFNASSGLNLDNLEGIKAIETYLNSNIIKTNYVWYSVYRTKVFKEIFNIMYKINVQDPVQIFEDFNTCLSFCYGKYKFINCNHYIRLANPSQKFAASIPPSDSMLAKLILDNKSNDGLMKILDYFVKELNFNKESIHNAIRSKLIKQKTKPIYTLSVFKLFYIKLFLFIYSRFFPFKYLSLKTFIKIINLYYLIKR